MSFLLFDNVYSKFKLHFYQEIFRRFQDREASLTTMETFCVESIQALGSPTVNEFATFMRISTPNAAYKVNSLVDKGYIRKIRSEKDRREYHLEVTQKYLDYYNNRRIKAKRKGLPPAIHRQQALSAA
jgi:DNA-binding MarR family transcriptional regulator